MTASVETTTETSPAARIIVEPLHCERCGGPVPLGEGDSAICPYCQAVVVIPAAYVELRASVRLREGDAHALDSLYEEATRPPSRALESWANAGMIAASITVVGAIVLTIVTVVSVFFTAPKGETAGAMAVAMVFLSVPALLATLAHFVTSHGYDVVDGLGPFFGLALGLCVYVILVVPISLGGLATDALDAIRRLRESLRAGKPLHPGGPATCRSCGGALEIAEGSLGVRCVYCLTDNLLTLAGKAATKESERVAAIHRDVLTAIEAHRKERAGIRAKLVPSLLEGLIWVLAIFGLLHLPTRWVMDDFSTFGMFRMTGASSLALMPVGEGEPIAANTTGTIHFTVDSCSDGGDASCAIYYVALNRGDRLSLSPSRSGFSLTYRSGTHRTGDGSEIAVDVQRHGYGLGACSGNGWVTDSDFDTAPYTGFYRIVFRGPHGLRELGGLHFNVRAPAPLPLG